MKKNLFNLIFLHATIMIFSLTGIFSKMLANSINTNGVWHINTIIFLGLMVFNCGIYAILWQQNLKRNDIQVAYAHRSIYNIWSLIWAYALFHEKLTWGNIVGTVLIIFGVIVIQGEKEKSND